MNELADLLWLKLPQGHKEVSGSRSGWPSAIGVYLRTWPPVAVFAPVGGFVLGLLLGVVHPGPL